MRRSHVGLVSTGCFTPGRRQPQCDGAGTLTPNLALDMLRRFQTNGRSVLRVGSLSGAAVMDRVRIPGDAHVHSDATDFVELCALRLACIVDAKIYVSTNPPMVITRIVCRHNLIVIHRMAPPTTHWSAKLLSVYILHLSRFTAAQNGAIVPVLFQLMWQVVETHSKKYMSSLNTLTY